MIMTCIPIEQQKSNWQSKIKYLTIKLFGGLNVCAQKNKVLNQLFMILHLKKKNIWNFILTTLQRIHVKKKFKNWQHQYVAKKPSLQIGFFLKTLRLSNIFFGCINYQVIYKSIDFFLY
jgi:hypothetical protein